MRFRTVDTNLVHAGTLDERPEGAVCTPVFQSANYLQDDPQSYADIRYIRLNNTPNHRVLAEKLAAIEGSEAALVTASGMAAISAAVLSCVTAGDHVLVQQTVYGGTRTFFANEASRFGIEHTTVDTTSDRGWEDAVRPQTRVFYVEGLSNPLIEVADLRAVLEFSARHGLVTIIDNTFLTPVNYQPIPDGFDLVVHSATKYLNGHSDIVAGVVAGSVERVSAAAGVVSHLGGSLDPHACFLLERGLKTLALRVRQQNRTALALATALQAHPAVARVCYPGLASDPGAGRAKDFLGCSGMVSFFLSDPKQVDPFLERLTIPVNAASLGGVETLIVRPSKSTHMGMPESDRLALGITDALVRVSVGVEDTEELVADLLGALPPAP